MTKYLFPLLLIMISNLAAANAVIGGLAPSFSLSNSKGETVSLADFKGDTVILEWTNHDCPFVRKHYDSSNMQNLQKKYVDQGVIWLSIISSAEGKQGHVSGEKADQLTLSRNATPTHVLLDEEGTVGKLYGAKTTPHMYIINSEGTLLYNGAIDSIRSANPNDITSATNYVDLAMAELAQGKPLSKPLTRPYGCSVKY